MKKAVFFLVVLAAATLAAMTIPFHGSSSGETDQAEASLQTLAPSPGNPSAAAGKSGCGGSCCSPPAGSGGVADRTEAIRAYLTSYYEKNVGGAIRVRVSDLGCHHEADILRDGVFILRLSINGDVITRIG